MSGLVLPGFGAFLSLGTSHHQRHKHGLVQDEQPQKHKPWNYGPCDQEGDARRDEERPEPKVELEPER